MLEAQEIVQQNPRSSADEKRAGIERVWKFYIDWAVAAPGAGKMAQALAWKKKLNAFDELAPPSKREEQ